MMSILELLLELKDIYKAEGRTAVLLHIKKEQDVWVFNNSGWYECTGEGQLWNHPSLFYPSAGEIYSNDRLRGY
jgi:hypothetical protein